MRFEPSIEHITFPTPSRYATCYATDADCDYFLQPYDVLLGKVTWNYKLTVRRWPAARAYLLTRHTDQGHVCLANAHLNTNIELFWLAGRTVKWNVLFLLLFIRISSLVLIEFKGSFQYINVFIWFWTFCIRIVGSGALPGNMLDLGLLRIRWRDVFSPYF